ncbi:MAG: hypothetical protein NTZ13_01285 [Candidatus Parcubacteria bacterium]|nr:hypothetical protein [Candidatus Parcubacteria bacterium]
MQDTTSTKQNVPQADPQSVPKTHDIIKVEENSLAPHRGNFLPSMLLDKQNEAIRREGDFPLGKKTLPSHVRDHFEANSSAFVEFAQKKDTNVSKKIEVPQEMDEWDKALLLGEYPGGNIPKEIKISEKNTVTIPKKPMTTEIESVFPNQVLTEEHTEPIKSFDTPIEIHTKTIVLPRFISKKETFSPQTLIQKQTTVVSSANTMEETFQKKIIEGQMRSIFENAPAGTRETMEKLLATDIISEEGDKGGIPNTNDIWKRRLRDYITKIKKQRKIATKNLSEEIEPEKDETISSFIQRIYPTIRKNEAKKE